MSPPCHDCRRSCHLPVYYLSGGPVHHDRCELGAPGYPDLGPVCQWFEGRYPWGEDFAAAAAELDP